MTVLNQKEPGTQWLCFVLGVCATTLPTPTYTENPPVLKTVYQWNQLEFDYQSSNERQRDIDSGAFEVGNIAPIDVDVYYSPRNTENQVFITIPRFKEGIPATLGTVTNKVLNGNPIIRPYPDWRWHRNSNECHRDRIVSVFRVKIDECGRMWVLDTGKIGDNIVCKPQVLAFDLTTNQVLHRHEFPDDVVTQQYVLVTPEVDVRDPTTGCKNTFVYVADVLGFALLIYDVANDRSWRIQDKTFYPYPNYGTFTIAGESFDLMDGLLGMTLSPYIPGQDRILFYHAMASPTENWVYTSHLRNHTLISNSGGSVPQIFNVYRNTRNTQAAAEAMDKDGIMIFGLLGTLELACWNARTEYGPKNFDIIADDPVRLQFPSGIKIVRNQKGQQELWALTSRFQKLATGTLSPNEPNFRILAGKLEDLLYNSKCRSKRGQNNNNIGGGYGYLRGNAG
ncbi:major royal jelly protein 3-like isoform X2 [Anthonomus grandis grandis]|uniref:major royal jelly protein 3-like isoform X2 n=1 Tax=Anthonomus grandis grandis TaxID=2921223 RepID=UPI0021669CD1|nr:major royal jelly protein 3-like isoform X2 [Anthonomus grandis grandis]